MRFDLLIFLCLVLRPMVFPNLLAVFKVERIFIMSSLIASRLKRIKPSPTIAVTTRAAELKAAGQDVIGLGAVSRILIRRIFVIEAAHDAAKSRARQNILLLMEHTTLKDAIIAKFKRDNGLTYTRDQITVGSGGKQVLYNALMATLNGDEVIIPAPYWVRHPDMTLLAEGTPVIVECSERMDLNFKPRSFDAAITPKTKWLILNSPEVTRRLFILMTMKADGCFALNIPMFMWCRMIFMNIWFMTALNFVRLRKLNHNCLIVFLPVMGIQSLCHDGWRIGYAAGPKRD